MTMNAQNHRDLKIASVLNIHDVKVDDLLRQSRSFIPADIALGNQLRELDKSLSGAATILSDITTNGGTVPELQKNVKGTVKTKMADGAISGGTILKSVAGKVEKFLPLDRIDFRSMSFASVIKDEKVSIDTLTIASAKTGNWGAEGMVGFNGDLDILLKNRLPKGISDKAMQLKGAVTQTIGSELEKRGGSVGKLASGLVSQAAKSTGPQADKDGRVTFGIGLGGNIAKPVPQSFAFLPPDSPGKSQPAPSPKEQVTKQVKQKIDEQKKQLEAKARQEAEAAKMKAEAEAKKQAEAARKEAEKVEEKARDATDDAKKKLKGKLKKMF